MRLEFLSWEMLIGTGIKIPKKELDLIEKRLKAAKEYVKANR